jgi:hypothetical protein
LGKIGGKPVDKPSGQPERKSGDAADVASDFGESPTQEGDGEDLGGGGPIEADLAAMDDIPMDIEEFDVLVADRIRPEDVDQFPALAGKRPPELKTSRILAARWME